MKHRYILFVSAIATMMSLTSCDTLLALDANSGGTIFSTGTAVYDDGYGVNYNTGYAYSNLNYEQARRHALFLSDKMAYELGLNDMQYEAIYEINLDYLLNVRGENSLYGDLWAMRNTDIFYVLSPRQYNYFINMEYFYRPVYWYNNYYAFSIYNRYDNPRYYYRTRPSVYNSYRGGHNRYGQSYYAGRFGRRDGGPVIINRGNYANGGSRGNVQGRDFYNGTSSFGNQNRRNARTFGQGNRNVRKWQNNVPDRNYNSERTNTFGTGKNPFGNTHSRFGNSNRNSNSKNSNKNSNGSFGGNRSTFGNDHRSSFGTSNRKFGSGTSTSSSQRKSAPNRKSDTGGSFGGNR